MRPKFFIIFSLSRCGSTAIHRALNAHSEIDCLFEPDFSFANWDEKLVIDELERIRCIYTGIKYVWDPSGFPFVSTHLSSLPELDCNLHKVLDLNLRLLSISEKKVVFLRRRNQLKRILSDLLGQQTDLWGPTFSDARVSTPLKESEEYRGKIKTKLIKPVSVEITQWYLDHIDVLEEKLRRSVRRYVWFWSVYGV
jgi:hypothetical protein